MGLIIDKRRYIVTSFIVQTTLWTKTISFMLSGFTATLYHMRRWWKSWWHP